MRGACPFYTPRITAHVVMFDVGFSELLVIALVALIVVGPERLPKVARTAGILLGRLQRYVNDVKSDINRELQLEELKRLKKQVEESAREMETSVAKEISSVQDTLQESLTLDDLRLASESAKADEPVPPAAAEAVVTSPATAQPSAEAFPPASDGASAESPQQPQVLPQMELDLGQKAARKIG